LSESSLARRPSLPPLLSLPQEGERGSDGGREGGRRKFQNEVRNDDGTIMIRFVVIFVFRGIVCNTKSDHCQEEEDKKKKKKKKISFEIALDRR